MAERRRSKRIPFRKRINIGKDGKYTSGYTFNLSKEGIGIKGNGNLMPKNDVSIIFNINDVLIEVDGTIVYLKKTISSEPNLMGVSFENCPTMLKAIYNARNN